jgi:hypothetical protein
MESEMRSACLKAAAKLGIGLSLLAAVIGIRLVTVTPDGVESEIEKLKLLDARIASESSPANSHAQEDEPGSDDSILSRLSAGAREHMPSSDSGRRDGDKLVSCQLDGTTQFTRADDCAMRGGDSTVITHER